MQNHELTANVVDADALLYICHFSSEKCSQKIRLRSAPSSNNPVNGGFLHKNTIQESKAEWDDMAGMKTCQVHDV